MRFGIPLLADRVAPRCTFADAVLLVTTKRRRIEERVTVPLEGTTWADLAAVLAEHDVETLVCGGISRSTRESIRAREVAVIDNVAGTSEEVVEALRRGRVAPGFGLARDIGEGGGGGAGGEEPAAGEVAGSAPVPRDCLECEDRVCLEGVPCPHLVLPAVGEPRPQTQEILEAAWDVALESERALCRLAELVYFALEMGYKRLGVAFCEDLREPASILTRVLRRFFEVVPVGCRLGGDSMGPCNPSGVAVYLNSRDTDLNVLVGFCVGADCVFNGESRAPVTTIFVKDKSLANNPIGAVYSHYYLTEI
ncbi:MAG: DUF1847 domain-containing protein [Gemmatimonadales bacterium]|jgi:uncharacterized metal-binding protein/predicted Fe-Mo cluster-binding NifX family protein